MNRSLAARPLVVGLLAVAVAGCGSPSTGTAPSIPAQPPASSAAATPSDTPAPAATEVNPPGDIPDNQVFVTYRGASANYTVEVPEGWARTASGAAVSFTDKLNSVAADQTAMATAPTVASVTATDVPALSASVPQFSLLKVAPFTRPGGTGVLVTYLADSAPDPVTDKVVRDAVEAYYFWKNGQQVVLTLSGPKNADNVDPWARVSGSYRWTP